jgi:hypothetical protein
VFFNIFVFLLVARFLMNWFALHVEVSSQSLSNKIIMRKKLIKFLFTAGNNLKKEKKAKNSFT